MSAFLSRVQETGSIGRHPGSGRPTKQTEEVKELIEAAMRTDDETTSKELRE